MTPLLIPLLSAVLLAPPAAAAELVLTVGQDGKVVTASPPATPISLDLQDADIRSVLRLFGEHAGLNFVLDDSVQAKVTVQLHEVPWDQALAAILMVEGLGAVPIAAEGPTRVMVVEALD